jgi:hypothetical protein
MRVYLLGRETHTFGPFFYLEEVSFLSLKTYFYAHIHVYFYKNTDARMTLEEFQVLRVLEPALRMKAQADSNSRGRKDFICGEF